ncbi:winged helix-turn-helix transcriptional regulator [Sulfuriflexus mobilis]|uniref:winged helix-turn-helix transcriptional regulator n=1 Tax=Sulfuriflexus mobilis TaxID=1811807 RepID=UPI000F848131|nr:helix-turn-helix domain-containing protein [Sulfuriflexus mobilis]
MKKPQQSVPGQDCLRSLCPLSSVLDILGDKWTLLVVRDMLFLRKRLYKELADSAENIPTNILADRLKRLEAAAIIEKHPYQDRPVRYAYTLTEKGEALRPLLIELAKWGNAYIPGTIVPPEGFMEGK